MTIHEIQNQISALEQKLDITRLKEEKEHLERQTESPDFWNDQQNAQKISQKLASVSEEIATVESLTGKAKELAELEEMRAELDAGMVCTLDEEVHSLGKEFRSIELKTFLSGRYDKSDAILTIHAGQGGTEACDWTEMLLRMYRMYAEKKGWKLEITDLVSGNEAGIAKVTCEIVGNYAYGFLKQETGTHRLVRVSPFNAQGLRQTSFSGVEVLPVIEDDIEIAIKPEDISFSASRSGGAGGQNVNKVNTKVMIVHKPTGLQVQCSVERSQQQNRDRAMKMLRAKLYQIELEKQMAEEARLKGEHKTFGWGNQIRNYVLHPYKLVKDVRTNVESNNPEQVLDGNLDEFIEAEIKL
ncbi:MAG: peptide chain release factor 2 [Candidatus Dojkabacteria bacterium]